MAMAIRPSPSQRPSGTTAIVPAVLRDERRRFDHQAAEKGTLQSHIDHVHHAGPARVPDGGRQPRPGNKRHPAHPALPLRALRATQRPVVTRIKVLAAVGGAAVVGGDDQDGVGPHVRGLQSLDHLIDPVIQVGHHRHQRPPVRVGHVGRLQRQACRGGFEWHVHYVPGQVHVHRQDRRGVVRPDVLDSVPPHLRNVAATPSPCAGLPRPVLQRAALPYAAHGLI